MSNYTYLTLLLAVSHCTVYNHQEYKHRKYNFSIPLPQEKDEKKKKKKQ